MFQVFGPYLRENAYMPPIANILKDEPGPEAEWSLSGGNIHSEHYGNSKVLSDRRFENILTGRASRLNALLDIAFPPAEQELDRIIELIEFELAK